MVAFEIVVGWPAYRVGDDGSVWSCWQKGPGAKPLGPWKQMTPTIDKEGYRRVELRHVDGRKATCKVCSLVCIAFHGPRPEGLEVRHRDGNSRNDAATNLKWGTHLENIDDKRTHGTMARGGRHGKVKLTEAQIAELLALQGQMIQREAAVKFGVSRGYVGQLWSGARKRVTA